MDKPTFDPAFTAEGADLILCSSDTTYYRVSSYTLRTTSGFFFTMLSLPQGDGTPKDGDYIAVDETAKVLGTLLRMISGFEIPQWESYDHLETVLQAAEKYNMPGPLSVIRYAICSPLFQANPLRMYSIAARYNWEEEAKHASTQSLTLTIHDLQYVPILASIPSDYLIRLYNLHRRRATEFCRLLDSRSAFVIGNFDDQLCSECGYGIDNHPWRDLKTAMAQEVERRPMGDTVREKMNEWKVAQDCWSATCMNSVCQFKIYGQTRTLMAINTCIDSLPTTI